MVRSRSSSPLRAITLVNVVGIRRAVDTLGAMTMIKVTPLLLIGALGLVLAPIPAPVLPEFSAVESVSLVALYAFVGFEAATIPAGETRDPKRAIPRALLLTVAGVTLLYVVVQLAYSASGIGESDAPLADLAAQSLGPAGALLLGVTAIVSVLANQLSAVTSISRITSSLADQGLLPGWFGRISPRFATPANSILAVGGVGLALALSGTFVTLAVISTVSRLFAYLACIAAIPRLDCQGREIPIGSRDPAPAGGCGAVPLGRIAIAHRRMAGVRRLPGCRKPALPDGAAGTAVRRDTHRG